MKTILAVAAATMPSLVLLAGGVLSLPFKETLVVKGTDVSAGFAVSEFSLIVSNATGRAFPVGKTQGCRDGGSTTHRIFVGRSADAEKILGASFFDGLKDEESAVFARGNDLFLVGGGQLGCLWAVYDFLEDNLNFRHYFVTPNGYVVDKVDTVVFKGRDTRRRPKFLGPRVSHNDRICEALHHVRNRGNGRNAERIVTGYRCPRGYRVPGHGFSPAYIPRDDVDPHYLKWTGSPITNGYFKTHPEWFTLDKDGQRVKDAQICLSNPALRQELYDNLVKWIKTHGAGEYMVGSNDDQNDRYCWCEGCVALEKKYGSVGGPLWDWILWSCPKLETDGYKGVYVKSLAYKGPQQTERAPTGVEKFPPNFVCDAAFLNGDRPLRDVPDMKLEDGTVFNRLENLARWCRLCDHVSYWYYGGSNPGQFFRRMQTEINELADAGVDSVGSCGSGGGLEFDDFTLWIFFRLLRDPKADLEPDLKRIFEIKYGPAAAKAREYADALEAMVSAETKVKDEVTSWDDKYERFTFLSGGQLFKLRRLADEALELAKGTPYERHVKYMRFGINVWTIRMFAKMQGHDRTAAAKIDLAALESETREAEVAYFEERYPDHADTYRRVELKNIHLPSLQLDEMANYRLLKTETLPAELAGFAAEKVIRILPPKRKRKHRLYGGGWTSFEDPDAIAGFAWRESSPETKKVKASPAAKRTLKVECYDRGSRKWLLNREIPMTSFVPGRYTLVRIGRMPIPEGFRIVWASLWGSDVNTQAPARLFDPTYAKKEYDVWASVKCEGPWFYWDAPKSARSALSVDQIFCVDCGVPEGK